MLYDMVRGLTVIAHMLGRAIAVQLHPLHLHHHHHQSPSPSPSPPLASVAKHLSLAIRKSHNSVLLTVVKHGQKVATTSAIVPTAATLTRVGPSQC